MSCNFVVTIFMYSLLVCFVFFSLCFCKAEILSVHVTLRNSTSIVFVYDPYSFLSPPQGQLELVCLEEAIENFCYSYSFPLTDCFNIRQSSLLKLDDFKYSLVKEFLLEFPTNEVSNVIPKNVFQTYVHKNLVPNYVFENIKKFSKGYRYYLYDHKEAKSFLEQYFHNQVVKTYETLSGPHKADLLRYALLYVMGGVYIDIKTELLVPLDYLFNESHTIYTSLSYFEKLMFNGIIASPKQNPFFLTLINQIIHLKPPQADTYNKFIYLFYEQVQYLTNQSILTDSFSYTARFYNNTKFLLFQEKNRNRNECHDGTDRYDGCYFVFWGEEKVFKTRYTDYPWHCTKDILDEEHFEKCRGFPEDRHAISDNNLLQLMKQHPNSWMEHSYMLANQINNIYVNNPKSRNETVIFLLFQEAKNKDEFLNVNFDNYAYIINIFQVLLLYLKEVMVKFDLILIYYYYGWAKCFKCYNIDKNVHYCNFSYSKTIFEALQKYSLIITEDQQFVSSSNSSSIISNIYESYISSKVYMIIDTRESSQTIVDNKLKSKLWHSYNLIDKILGQIRCPYNIIRNYHNYGYLLQYNNNPMRDEFTTSKSSSVSFCSTNNTNCTVSETPNISNSIISYQEAEYYKTSNMLFLSVDYWITISDIVIYHDLIQNNIIAELNHISKSTLIIIFIETLLLKSYINILLSLHHLFILITSDSHANNAYPCMKSYINDSSFEANTLSQTFVTLLNHSYLVKWYGSNILINHPKLRIIPIGLKFQSISSMFFGESKQPIINVFSKYGLTPYENFINESLKMNLLFFNKDLNKTDNSLLCGFNLNIYKEVYDVLFHYNNFTYVDYSSLDEYFLQLSTYRFCLFLSYLNIDNHHIWECLMVGTIPILFHSPLDSLYDGLPVLFINKENLYQISPDYLNMKYKEFISKRNQYDFTKLYTPFWKDLIMST